MSSPTTSFFSDVLHFFIHACDGHFIHETALCFVHCSATSLSLSYSSFSLFSLDREWVE